jgi:broad specificity phosphatase PhoE
MITGTKESMPRRVLFVTHADVEIDPTIPVPDWRLSPLGRARHRIFSESPAPAGVIAIYSSDERKARDGAEILAAGTGAPHRIVRALRENDRSATGYLPRPEFEAMADRFFANPSESVAGWERAIDAQARIVAAIDTIIATEHGQGDIAIVAHGGVGALLLAWLSHAPISRAFDQPGSGGGNWFAFDAETRALIHGWRDIAPAPAR